MSDIEQAQAEDYKSTPKEQADRWAMEFAAAKREVEKWHTQGRKIIERFLDERPSERTSDVRWNMFTSNVQIQMAMLYGKTPKVSVDRRFSDADDDPARVASEMSERLLNTDIERDDDTFGQATKYAVCDRLLSGMGSMKFRYVCETEDVPEEPERPDPTNPARILPAIPAGKRKTFEDVETDYVPWEDQLWSPCKVFHLSRWWAFRFLMSRKALKKRWPKHGERIPLNHGRKEGDPENPWGRAEVWEIWDKENKQRCYYVEGYPELLECEDDPYQLSGFYPFPQPIVANPTTSKFLPRPDYVLCQDLYDEIDLLATRIQLLEQAIRVTGGYNADCDGIQQILDNSKQNKLYPVSQWAMFAEKGGVEGQISWLPLDKIVAAITALQLRQDRIIEGVFQLTGMSDIMRGQANTSGVTATEQQLKSKFGSVRIQSMQDEIGRFCSDGQRIRAEIIFRHFDAQTIIQRSNIERTPDAQYAQAAVELLKGSFRDFRIEVKPEAVALTDFAQQRSERMESLGAMSQFLGNATPMIQHMGPPALPYLLKMLQWFMAGHKGASGIESVLDQAITAAEKAAEAAAANPQQKEDPALKVEQMKAQTQQMKGQQDLQKVQLQTQAHMMELQAEVDAKARIEENQRQSNTREALEKAQIAKAYAPAPRPPAGKPNGSPRDR